MRTTAWLGGSCSRGVSEQPACSSPRVGAPAVVRRRSGYQTSAVGRVGEMLLQRSENKTHCWWKGLTDTAVAEIFLNAPIQYKYPDDDTKSKRFF